MKFSAAKSLGYVLLGACLVPSCTNSAPTSTHPTAVGRPTSVIAAKSAGGTGADAATAAGAPAAVASDVPRENGVAAVTSAGPISNVRCPESTFEPEPGTACGELHCLAFTSESAAFAHVLELQPRVLGIGESHAQKGSETIHSATRRFAQELLPVLCGRAKSIILEIWLPRNDCGDKRVEQVKKAQKPVTSSQAKTNQDEYVTLGHVAKRLGIAPFALVPTCDEYQSILDAGPDTIERMLQLIGKRTGERVVEELNKLAKSSYRSRCHRVRRRVAQRCRAHFGSRGLQLRPHALGTDPGQLRRARLGGARIC